MINISKYTPMIQV